MVAWCPIGFVLLATQRYYKTQWLLMFHSHNLLGIAVFAVTVWSCLKMYAFHDWKQNDSVHSVLGLIALLLSVVVGVTGLVTAAMMQIFSGGGSQWRERDRHYLVAKVHRYSGWFMILLGNAVCSGGTASYFSKIGFSVYGVIGLSTSLIFLAVVAVHEYFRRRFNRNNFRLVEGEELWASRQGLKSWTPSQIERAVAQGDPLVICDNMVLRTDGYERIHPGGRFTIEKNFGRDIAKFYYGNYSLTNGKMS